MSVVDRAEIVKLCEEWLPATTDLNAILHWHQIGFNHIAKDYGQGSGTTCGFLPHWLLWRMGCTDTSLVNRSVPELGFKSRIGRNLSIFSEGNPASLVRVDGALSTAMANGKGGPQRGDFVIIRGGFWMTKSTGLRDRDSSHIFVLLDVEKADGKEVRWRIAQSGLSTHGGLQGGHITTVTGKLKQEEVMDGNTKVKGPSLVFFSNILNEEANFPRRVSLYTDVSKISFGGPRDDPFTKLFENRRTEMAKNDPNTIYPWLGWYEEASPSGFIKLANDYIVLERGNEANRLVRNAGGSHHVHLKGVWTRKGDQLDIQWRDQTRQSWNVTRSFVPKEATSGTPISGNGGTLTKLKRMPADVPPWWANANLAP